MFKSKTIGTALAALTLGAALVGASSEAQAHHAHWRAAAGIGFAAGALIGAAAVSNAYAAPAYYYGGPECRTVVRYDRWGYRRYVRVCDAGPY